MFTCLSYNIIPYANVFIAFLQVWPAVIQFVSLKIMRFDLNWCNVHIPILLHCTH